jgi:hypothetical protein
VRLGEVPEELMFAARITRATPEELESYKQYMQLATSVAGARVVPRYNASIGLRNEIAALSWLQDTTKGMLAKYRSSYEVLIPCQTLPCLVFSNDASKGTHQ